MMMWGNNKDSFKIFKSNNEDKKDVQICVGFMHFY